MTAVGSALRSEKAGAGEGAGPGLWPAAAAGSATGGGDAAGAVAGAGAAVDITDARRASAAAAGVAARFGEPQAPVK